VSEIVTAFGVATGSTRTPKKGLDELLPFILRDRNDVVLVLGGYFDESEREDAADPICVGGYLFKAEGYKKFKHKWNRDVLCGGRFQHFHMTDLCAGKIGYEGLSIPKRLEILNGAANAIAKHSYAGLAIHFDRDEFVSAAPPEWPDLRGSIYTAACHMCLQTTAYWLRQWKCDSEVLYVFERGHKFQAEADAVLTAIGNNAVARRKFLYRNHIFEPKTEVGLQAADLLAWTITKATACAGNVPPAMRPFVEPILRLASAHNTTGRQKVYPFTGDRLKRFINEQLNGTNGIPVELGPHRKAFR
jgi:hypothetical protein